MHDRLLEILEHKKSEVEALLPRADNLRAAALERNDFRSLERSLRAVPGELRVIAEVKKASPSAGVISKDFDYLGTAREYDRGGAAAISVLTDEKFFQGSLSYLTQIRREVSIPVLRKDFIIHEAQIYEAVVAGADAILLIVAALEQDELEHLLGVAETYQLDVLTEVHDLNELERALDTDATIIGINNRNLHTFEVDLETTEDLLEEIAKDHLVISESGIRDHRDAETVAGWGADGILVGESLMRSEKIYDSLLELRVPREEIPGRDEMPMEPLG